MFSNSVFSQLDYNLQYEGIIYTPQDDSLLEPLQFQKRLNDSTYIIRGIKPMGPPMWDIQASFAVFNQHGERKHVTLLGRPDVDDWISSYDSRNTDTLFFGVMDNQSDTYMGVYNMDLYGNIRWQHSIDGLGHYTNVGVIATSDGGCLWTAAFADSTLPPENFHHDIIMIKMDKDGNYPTLSINDKGRKHADVSVYPNPCHDYFRVSPELPGTGVEIYDMTGRSLYKCRLDEKNARVPADMLTPGIYFVRVRDGNKTNEVVKLIKN